MKIRIHKRFRGLLSLLVAVTLLVGVMPSQVWQGTKADATVVCKIYFDKDHNLYTPGNTEAWHDSNHYNFDSVYVYYVVSGTAHKDIMSWDATKHCQYYEFTSMPSEMRFYSVENDNNKDDAWKVATNVISGTDIENDMVYYTNGEYAEFNGGNGQTTSYAKRKLYTVLSSSEISSNVSADMNVPVYGTFQKQAGRHYVKAVLYDYFSDYELQNGTTRTGKRGNTTIDSGITTAYTWADPERRMQHITFDKALSNDAYSNNSNYSNPLYFGDIHHEDNGYNFQDFNNMPSWGLVHQNHYLQLYHDNNSLRRNGTTLSETEKAIPNAATTGLYKSDISNYQANRSLTTNAARLKLVNGADAKWFDSGWLAGSNSTTKRIGASYDVDFPFWEIKKQRTINNTQWAESNYFYINSELSDHALRLKKESGASGQYYLAETKQGIYNFTGNDTKYFEHLADPTNPDYPKPSSLTSTYGFFPFNDKSDFYDSTIHNYTVPNQVPRDDLVNLMDYQLRYDRANYGFGTYMVIPFKLNENGTMHGTTNTSIDAPITFTFSGDDDLLVYVDGKLVLDIGGNHGKVQGEINFNLQKSWVSRVKSTTKHPKTDEQIYNSNGGIWQSEEIDGKDKFYGYFSTRATLSSDMNTFTYSTDNTALDGVTDISSVCTAGTHTMEIFYVERGDFDSNMEIMYNLPVVEDRSFTVNENISTTGVNEIFTNTSQTGDNAGNNTGATNFNKNVAAMEFEMDVQFSDPGKETFTTILGNQTNPGQHPANYTLNTETQYSRNFGTTGNVYTASMVKGDKLTYQNDFIKPYDYNLKVSQGANFTFGDSSHAVSSLFTTTWTLAKYGSTSNENTGQGSGSGPVHTTITNNTGTGSRPKRGTKTTSTSPGSGNDTSFDFRGTVDNPDVIEFINNMNTGTLTINKSFTRKFDDNAAHTFTFTVTFDNVGGINLEESGGVQATPNNVITATVSVSYAANESGNKTVQITGIPVNTKYTVVENDANPTGYMTTYDNNINTTAGTIISTGNNAGVANSPSGAPEKIVLNLVVELGSTDTLASANDLPEVKLSIQRRKGSENWEELTTVTVPRAVSTSQSAQQTSARSESYPTTQNYMDKYDASTAYEYRVLAYKADDTTLITDSNTEYGDTNGFIVYYNAEGVPANMKNGTAAIDDDSNSSTPRVLEMGIKLTLPAQNNIPDTGRTGGYVPIAGGFIAILLAGAGYFIYKKRIFA